MTDAQRTALFTELMRGVPSEETDEYAALLAKLTREEMKRVEPLIDGWLVDAYNAGCKFAGRRTVEEVIQLEPRRVD